MARAVDTVQYLVLGDGTQPYFLARVRWPDVAQAISEDCPTWLDDPGLFDLPYEPASQRVSRRLAAAIAAEWGARLPLDSTTGFSEPRLRRIPATWSDMVPVEKRSWSLEHICRPDASPRDTAGSKRPREAHGGMSDTRLTGPATEGRTHHRPKHARPDSDVVPRQGRPDPQAPTTPHLGNDYRLRGLDFGSASPRPQATAAAASAPRPAATRRRARARQRRKRWLIMVAAAITTFLLVAVLLRLTLITPFTVPSSAMAPTLQAGDRIIVVRSSLLTGSIGRGDIVVFHRPAHMPCQISGSGQYLVQRVIGLPGETIFSSHQTIYIDGKPIAERGWFDPGYGAVSSLQIAKTTIPKSDYFVLADNRSDSCDSRSFGAIPGSSALGKVVAVIARNGAPYLRLF